MEHAFEEFMARLENIARDTARETAKATIEEFQIQKETRKNLVDTKQAAAHLGISIPTLIRRRDAGEVPAYRLGGRILYDLDEIDSALVSTCRDKKKGD